MARLLLVDDNPNVILKQVHRVFDPAGHEIDAARTGEDGVRQAATRTPDAILLRAGTRSDSRPGRLMQAVPEQTTSTLAMRD